MKKRHIIAAFLSAFMIAAVPAGVPAVNTVGIAAEETENPTFGDFTYRILGDEVQICSCDKSVTKAEIPEEIDGHKVTMIGDQCFWGCSDLSDVTLPEGITDIGKYAFLRCESLRGIVLPESLESIQEHAFDLSGLTSIIIPENVSEIGQAAFACKFLQTITVAPRNASFCVVNGALMDTKEKRRIIAFPAASDADTFLVASDVETIDAMAFAYTSNLKNVYLQKGTATIGREAFMQSGITNIILPDNITEIGIGAFRSCADLAKITLSQSLTDIPQDAFFNCSSVKELLIPQNVTSIGKMAFGGMASLEKLVIENPSCTIPNEATTLYDAKSTDSSYKTTYSFSGTIYGLPDSTAQEFAENVGYNFKPIIKPVYGDADGNGSVTVSDVVSVLQYVSNKEKYPLSDTAIALCDVYNNGSGITADDAFAIQQFDAGIEPFLPVSYTTNYLKWKPGEVFKWNPKTEKTAAGSEIISDFLYLPPFPDQVLMWKENKLTLSDGLRTTEFDVNSAALVCFSDLNDDGYPELCISADYGSGLRNAVVTVYDIRNRKGYVLPKEHLADSYYELYITNEGKLLLVHNSEYKDVGVIATGVPAIVDGELTMK